MERYLDAIAAVVPAEDHTRARLQVRAVTLESASRQKVEVLKKWILKDLFHYPK